MMFPAFCWHDLPRLIKACDYHINALPTPPLCGFSPLPSTPPPCTLLSGHGRERALAPESTFPAWLCFLQHEKPKSAGRNHPALSLSLPHTCLLQGSGPWRLPRTCRRETEPPDPQEGHQGRPSKLCSLIVPLRREANLTWMSSSL